MSDDVEPSFMITTIDNPYNPYTQWDDWLAFDERKGYNSLGLVARVALYSDEMSDKDITLLYEQAVEEVVRFNVLGIHALAYKDGHTGVVPQEQSQAS